MNYMNRIKIFVLLGIPMSARLKILRFESQSFLVSNLKNLDFKILTLKIRYNSEKIEVKCLKMIER